jgi:hypothetical protein
MFWRVKSKRENEGSNERRRKESVLFCGIFFKAVLDALHSLALLCLGKFLIEDRYYFLMVHLIDVEEILNEQDLVHLPFLCPWHVGEGDCG